MTRIVSYLKTAKFYAAMIGAGATAASGVAGAPAWLLVVGSIVTAVAMWEIPYQPAEPAETA